MILSQLVQNNLDLFEAERQKLSLKRISKPRNIQKKLDIFRFADNSNSSSTQIQPFSYKYREIWRRARIKVKEKLAKRRFKELEMYDSFNIQNFEDRIRRLHSIKNELIGTSAEILTKPSFIIHPKSKFAKSWNFFMIFILFYTGTVMPFRVAFIDGEVFDIWWILDSLLNLFFFTDLILTCFTAFYDDSNKVVFSLHKIFLRYLKGWLLIDIFACFPLDVFMEGKGDNYNNLLRLLRLPRLYRLCKLSKLLKYLRSKQGSGNIFELLNLKESHLKFIGFFFTVIICSHVMACMFYFAAKYNDFSLNTWVFKYGYLDESSFNKYIASMYWTYTTLSTVGYGDITPCSNLEIILALLWMVFGICFFSFTIGSLASMMSGVDTKEALLTTKLSYVDEFARECNVSKDLKSKLKAAMRYSTEVEGYSWKNKQDIFEELPMKIRYEVTLVMHKQAADRINFFMDKDPVFITAIIPMLTPVRVPGSEHIYFKDDIPEEIYFIIKGKVSFVHEKRNFTFVSFLEGSHFGDIEVLLESKRKFHAFCTSPCNLLALNYEGISVIQNEFQSIWQEMARNARKKENLLTIAVEQAVKICDMKSDMQLVNYTHEEVKEMYNDFIFTQVRRQKKTDHEEKQESPAEKLVNKLAEFGSEVKAINLKASVMCEKVRIIEKFLLGPEHVI